MHCNFVDFPTWVIVLDLNFFHYFFVDKGKFSRAIFSQPFDYKLHLNLLFFSILSNDKEMTVHVILCFPTKKSLI